MHQQTYGHDERSAAWVQAYATRNLSILRAIESTLGRMQSDADLLHTLAADTQEVRETLMRYQPPHILDPEGIVCKSLYLASDSMAHMRAEGLRQLKVIKSSSLVHEDDGFEEAVEAYLRAIETNHDQIEELREWIETHDALLQPPGSEVYSSADDLFKALGIGA